MPPSPLLVSRASISRVSTSRALISPPRHDQSISRWIASSRIIPVHNKTKSRSGPGRYYPFLAAATIGAAIAWNSSNIERLILGDGSASEKEEPPRRIPKVLTKTDHREHDDSLIDFYRNQVENSRKKPGLLVWGSNRGLVAAPDLPDEKVVKRPRRIPFLDGMVLRAVKLREDFGVAVTESGDLIQWGVAFDEKEPSPQVTLKDKNVVKVAASADRIVALTSSGSVYSLPVSKSDQLKAGSVTESSWLGYWTTTTDRGVRVLKPPLGYNEKVVDVSSGLTHCLLLTSSGRVFSAACSSSDFPSRGQLGVPGLTWDTRPEGPYDQPYRVKIPGGKIKQIATGDSHSVTLDDKGSVYLFGDNSFGQLGRIDTKPIQDVPTKLEDFPPVMSIAAGGCSTFFTTKSKGNPKKQGPDIWASGSGTAGTLGVGARIHATKVPQKVKKLSSLSEWSERKGAMIPIRPGPISVGATHSCVLLQSGVEEWPAYVWGGNESFELGTGKRRNLDEPSRMLNVEGGKKADQHEYYFAAAPKQKTKMGEGKHSRTMTAEQRMECGQHVSGIYMGV